MYANTDSVCSTCLDPGFAVAGLAIERLATRDHEAIAAGQNAYLLACNVQIKGLKWGSTEAGNPKNIVGID